MRGGFWTMPVLGQLFFQSEGANGAMSLHYCAADCCLKIEASPTGHECTSVWAWKRACCLNMVLHCQLKALPSKKALVMWPVSLLSQRMTQYHHLSVFFSPCNNLITYHTPNSFSEDELVAASQTVHPNFICLQKKKSKQNKKQPTAQWHRENVCHQYCTARKAALTQCITWLFLNL